jgi:hypothetical protein
MWKNNKAPISKVGRAIQSNYPILSNINRIIETKHSSFESILSQIEGSTIQQGMCHRYAWVRRFYLSLIGSKTFSKLNHPLITTPNSLPPSPLTIFGTTQNLAVHKGSVSNVLNHITLCSLVHLKALNSLKPKPLQVSMEITKFLGLVMPHYTHNISKTSRT